MKHLDDSLADRIDHKLNQLQRLRPLPGIAVEKLRKQFAIEMTYNSNAIEGNQLTLKETFLVINEGITIKGKSLKDHLEAKDHYEAIDYLYELIQHDKKQTISELTIRDLQKLIVKETDANVAGRYRTGNVIITGSKHIPIDASEVPAKMRDLITWHNREKERLHPIELAAIFHHKLVNIHPFFDGNGRTARLLMNLILMQQGYPLVMILKNDRKQYYQALEKADKDDYEQFVKLIAQAVERSMNIYLKVLLPASATKEKFLSLSDLSNKYNYSEKYLNLLARQGKIEAHKEGRNWVSTVEAIKRYQKNRIRQRK